MTFRHFAVKILVKGDWTTKCRSPCIGAVEKCDSYSPASHVVSPSFLVARDSIVAFKAHDGSIFFLCFMTISTGVLFRSLRQRYLGPRPRLASYSHCFLRWLRRTDRWRRRSFVGCWLLSLSFGVSCPFLCCVQRQCLEQLPRILMSMMSRPSLPNYQPTLPRSQPLLELC